MIRKGIDEAYGMRQLCEHANTFTSRVRVNAQMMAMAMAMAHYATEHDPL